MQRTTNLDLWFAGQITYLDLNAEEQAYVNAHCDDAEEASDQYEEHLAKNEPDEDDDEEFEPGDDYDDYDIEDYEPNLSYSQQCYQDRADYAREALEAGDITAEQAEEIRHGA